MGGEVVQSKIGRPSMPGKSKSQLRIDTELFEKLKIISRNEGRSMNAQVERFIQEGVRRYEEQNGKVDI